MLLLLLVVLLSLSQQGWLSIPQRRNCSCSFLCSQKGIHPQRSRIGTSCHTSHAHSQPTTSKIRRVSSQGFLHGQDSRAEKAHVQSRNSCASFQILSISSEQKYCDFQETKTKTEQHAHTYKSGSRRSTGYCTTPWHKYRVSLVPVRTNTSMPDSARVARWESYVQCHDVQRHDSTWHCTGPGCWPCGAGIAGMLVYRAMSRHARDPVRRSGNGLVPGRENVVYATCTLYILLAVHQGVIDLRLPSVQYSHVVDLRIIRYERAER